MGWNINLSGRLLYLFIEDLVLHETKFEIKGFLV